jgi:hypothetical protein
VLYLFLLYWDDTNPGGDMDEIMSAHHAVAATARSRDAYICSEAVGGRANATTVRIRDGKTLTTDGPYAETKEVMGGFYVIDCEDLDEALEYAAQIPDAKHGAVEVRPVMHVPGWDYGPTSNRVRQPMG